MGTDLNCIKKIYNIEEPIDLLKNKLNDILPIILIKFTL